jgi:hypothetical protein
MAHSTSVSGRPGPRKDPHSVPFPNKPIHEVSSQMACPSGNKNKAHFLTPLA